MGEQRMTNYALRAPDKATFMDLVTANQPPAPGYFVYDAILNRKDRDLLDETKPPRSMTYAEVRAAVAGGAVLVDGRAPEEFALGHLRGAVNIGLDGRYAEFAGSVVKPDNDIVLMTEPGQELEGKKPLGPNRFRPGHRLPRRAVRGDVHPSRRRRGGVPADCQWTRGIASPRCRSCNWSTSAIRAKRPPAW